MLIAQLTDTHVLDPAAGPDVVDNNARLAEAVALLNAERPRPDVVLATGDMTNDGQPEELAELLRLLEPLELPVLALPGNHDDHAQFRAAFDDHPWAADDHLSWVVEVAGLQIIGLDATVPGKPHGDFDEERQAWLAQALADTAGENTLVALHHPPFESGLAFMDTMRLHNAEAFVAMVAAAPHVTRVVCGHLHRPAVSVINGVTMSTCLSTVHHPMLDLDPNGPGRGIVEPAGYQLHRWQDGVWVSHTRYLGIEAEPFYFG